MKAFAVKKDGDIFSVNDIHGLAIFKHKEEAQKYIDYFIEEIDEKTGKDLYIKEIKLS